MPKKEENQFAPQIDFKEQTPEIQLNKVKPDPLYEKAFLFRRISIRANMLEIHPLRIKS